MSPLIPVAVRCTYRNPDNDLAQTGKVTATAVGRSRVLASVTVVTGATVWTLVNGALPLDAALVAPPSGTLYYSITEWVDGYVTGPYLVSVTAADAADGLDLSAFQTTENPQDVPLQVVPGPAGTPGPPGAPGPATTLDVVSTTTGAPGSAAQVTVSGAAPNQHLSFAIPTGAAGAPGPQGATGSTGPTGLTGPPNSLDIGSVTTSSPGSTASASVTGTAPSQELNLTLPQGAQGPPGSGAPDATTSTKGSVRLLGGTADNPITPAASVSGLAPVATSGAYTDLSGRPSIPATAADVSAQPVDSDLTTLAAIDANIAGVVASDGSGWLRKTYAQLKTALGLVKSDVGLANVDNTADTAKPISTAQQAALNAKLSTTDSSVTNARPWTLYSGSAISGQVPTWNGSSYIPSTPTTTALTVRSVSANTTAVVGELLKVDASSGSRTITPPSTPAVGERVSVIKVDSSTNAVTWNGLTNSDASAAVISQWAGARFVWDGTIWLVDSVNVAYSGGSSGTAVRVDGVPVATYDVDTTPVTPAEIGAAKQLTFRQVARTSGDLTIGALGPVVADGSFDLIVPAAAGDIIEISRSCQAATGTSVIDSSVYLEDSTGSVLNNLGGVGFIGSWTIRANDYWGSNASIAYTARAQDIRSDGTIRFVLVAGANPTRTIFANSGNPFTWWAKNFGPSA